MRLRLFALAQPVLALAAQAHAPFTVDLMMRNEAFGRAAFDPTGSRLVFERHRPYGEMMEYDDLALTGERRGKLYVAEAGDGTSARSLFPVDSPDGYALGPFSPDGRRMIYIRSYAQRSVIGTYDFDDSRVQEFPIPLEPNIIVSGPIWISETDILFPALRSGARDRRDKLSAAWQDAREGRRATVSILGSGRERAPSTERPYALVRANAVTGRAHVLADGHFRSWALSPDATRLAAVDEIPHERDPAAALENASASSGLSRRSLVIFDLVRSTADTDVCRECDVVPTSLAWSSSGKQLGFFARPQKEHWDQARFWIYRPQAKQAQPVDLGRLIPTVVRTTLFVNPHAAWLGDSLMVMASVSGERRPSWFVIEPQRSPRELTTGFDAPAEVIGTTGRGVFVLSAGELWNLEPAGRRELLTGRIARPVEVEWPRPNPFGSVFSPVLRDSVVLRTSQQTWLLDPLTYALELIPTPRVSGPPLAASRSSSRVALVAAQGNASSLVVAQRKKSPRKLATINRHLLGVARGHPVRLDHDGPQGERLTSWLLLPPQFQSGSPIPTVTSVYPGIGNLESWGHGELQDTLLLNPHLLTARGYAVLFPSLPLSEKVPRDLLNELSPLVLAAVDAAVEAGYSDPARLVLQGHSAGGYTVYATITQTQKFKAAIALSGVANLVSFYGQLPDPMMAEPSLYIPSFVETGLFGLGAPPWQHPQRYSRNSPLMRAASIDTPLMIVQGDLDYVSMKQGEEMFTALLRQGKDGLFVRYWGEGHDPDSPANIRDLWTRMLGWYDAHLQITSYVTVEGARLTVPLSDGSPATPLRR